MTKKALFLSGGWEGHEPQETSEFISSELQQFKIQSEIVNDLDVLGDIDFLKNFDKLISKILKILILDNYFLRALPF